MAIIDTLNIRRDEVISVSLLVFQSFFLGVFLGAFDISANTLFLNAFEQDMIAKAIVVSGFVGILLTSVYSMLQARLKFSVVAAINLAAVFVLTFALRAGYYFSETKWLAFGMFVLMGPLNIVALVGFWGTVTRIFDLRQGKRIFGFIDAGQVLGVIISSFSVPFLINAGFKTHNLLYISSLSILFAFVVQLFISSKYSSRVNSGTIKEKKNTFGHTMKIPYVRTMAFFVVLSMLVAFFIHYLFLAVAGQRFQNPDELAKFFGGLMGSITFVSILIKTFVYGPLMRTYGLKVSLLIAPIVMTIVTVAAAVVGSSFGYTIESASFTFFFLLISLGKFFQKALKDSVESPVLKLIYQSLDPSIRYEVQARVDGTINEFAALSSGIILTLLGLSGAITLIHYIFFLIGIILIWFVISLKLFGGYRKTLQQTLEKAAVHTKESASNEWELLEQHNNLEHRLMLLENTKPWLIPKLLEKVFMLRSNNNNHLACIYTKQLAEVSLLSYIEKRLERSSGDEKAVLTETIAYLKNLQSIAQNPGELNRLIASKDHEDRVLAARCIWAGGNPEDKKRLTILLRDLVPAVKKQAIWAARGSRHKEVVGFLVDFLDKDEYAPLAHTALIGSSEIGLELLELGFNRSTVTDTFRIRILRVMPETGSAIAERVIFDKLSLTSPFRNTILNGLLKFNFVADDRDRLRIHQLLIEQCGICAWNLNALYNCPGSKPYEMLKSELEAEFNESRLILFSLLKTIYTKSSIDAVLENIETGTGESISYAIELLDTFIDEDLKPYITPLLEDTGLTNRIWALQNYFPLKSYTHEEVLKAILNRNQNLMGKTAKILALEAFKNLKDLSVSADLIAQIFNSDRVLSEISTRLVEEINQQAYTSARFRLGNRKRVEIERSTQVTIESGREILDRLFYFKQIFPKNEALFWLYNSIPVTLSGENLIDLPIFANNGQFILIETGELTLTANNSETLLKEGQTAYLDLSLGNITRALAGDSTTLHYIDIQKIRMKLFDVEFLSKYFDPIILKKSNVKSAFK